MKLTTILFDLDGTLLPMDFDLFMKGYFKLLSDKAVLHGYEPRSFVGAVWKGTAAMVRNDGSATNEEVFWKTFVGIYGEKGLADRAFFDEFYENEFQQVRAFCGYNPEAGEAVRRLKNAGFRIALATNPVFPRTATESRARWAGVEVSAFALCTTYENTCFCKPNPDYYRDLLKRLGVSAEECLMLGNDVDEDMVAETVGLRVFLLSDCLINKNGKDISAYPQGGFRRLLEYAAEIAPNRVIPD